MSKQKSSKLTRRQMARHDKEKLTQKLIARISVVIAIVLVLILGYGLVTELLIKDRRIIAKIGATTITTKTYQVRQRYEREMLKSQLEQYQTYMAQFDAEAEEMQSFLQQLQLTASNIEQQLSADYADILGKQVLDQMVEEELIRQKCQELGITVSSDEITLGVEEMMGYDREAAQEAAAASATVTETASVMTAEKYAEVYDFFNTTVLQSSRMSESKFREMMEASLLREKLYDTLAEEIDTIEDQVEVTFFYMDTEEAGQALSDRINGEEDVDVEALVAEFNEDDNDQTFGYSFPWLPSGYISESYSAEIETIAFNTPVGTAAAPIISEDGETYYVIYVSGHEERELEEDMLSNVRDEVYQAWLDEQMATVEYLDWEVAVVVEE